MHFFKFRAWHSDDQNPSKNIVSGSYMSILNIEKKELYPDEKYFFIVRDVITSIISRLIELINCLSDYMITVFLLTDY